MRSLARGIIHSRMAHRASTGDWRRCSSPILSALNLALTSLLRLHEGRPPGGFWHSVLCVRAFATASCTATSASSPSVFRTTFRQPNASIHCAILATMLLSPVPTSISTHNKTSNATAISSHNKTSNATNNWKTNIMIYKITYCHVCLCVFTRCNFQSANYMYHNACQLHYFNLKLLNCSLYQEPLFTLQAIKVSKLSYQYPLGLILKQRSKWSQKDALI